MLINRPVYLSLSILELSKTVLYESRYDYVNQNIEKKQNYITWIQILRSNYELDKSLARGKKWKSSWFN